MQVNLTDSSDNIHSTSSNSRQHTLTLGSLWNTMRRRTPQQGRIQDFSEGVPHTKSGGGGGGGGNSLQVRYTKSGGGGGGQSTSGPIYEKWGGNSLQIRYENTKPRGRLTPLPSPDCIVFADSLPAGPSLAQRTLFS